MLGLGRPTMLRRALLQPSNDLLIEITDDELGHGAINDSTLAS